MLKLNQGAPQDGEGSPESEGGLEELVTLTLPNTDAPAALPVRWSSHPIVRYTVGDFQFENGLLTLATQEEADAFQAVFDTLPIYERTRLNKIDVAAAEALVRERFGQTGGATKGIDSATGDRAPNKQVGSGDLIQG